MKRLIDSYLNEWKNTKQRKVLLVRGARQVGKTYSILFFDEIQACPDDIRSLRFFYEKMPGWLTGFIILLPPVCH